MNIVTESPFWLIIFCFALGVTYAGILYYQNLRLKEFPLWLLRLLAATRFICISILAFLLLSPVLEVISRKLEKPIVVIAQDVSESILLGKDSAYYQNEYLNNLRQFSEELKNKYETVTYSFAENTLPVSNTASLKFSEKLTDISSFFEEIETRYSNRNVGAIIMASDGLYNKGANPLYASEKLKVPIYTIAMGDTTVKKDLSLIKVEQNRIAYLGNDFPLQVVVNAKKLKGKTTTLSIKQGEKLLFTQAIDISADAFIATIPVMLEATATGLQRYRVSLSSLPEEESTLNNSKNVYMEVLDARQKVLILMHAPHPDIAAIKASIAGNENYEVEVSRADELKASVNKYNLIILHQIPHPQNAYNSLIQKIRENKIPVWTISSANTMLDAKGKFVSITQQTNDCEAILNKDFPLFTISKALGEATKKFPPIVCPFGDYPAGRNSNALFYQRIGMVETKTPIMSFSNNNEVKSAIFYGEGIWKWRLHDYLLHENHQLFDEIISKTVQYLSLDEDKSFFKVKAAKAFFENESIVMEAEVYNQSYELINEPEVSITITNAEKLQFPFTFSKTINAYRLDAGRMPVGEYKYEAKVKVGDQIYRHHGAFSIVELQLEDMNSIADHQLLYAIAEKHDGEMISPDQLDQLKEKLMAREDIKTIAYEDKKMADLINYKWIFYVLLFLLSLEWFLRKRNGAY